MAKKFGGFTPQQQQTLLSKMGYSGPAQQDDLNKFMMSSPKAASMMGRYAQMAKARVEGGPRTAMQVGGYMAPPNPMQQPVQPLDYNRLYANPNQQQRVQQPIAMQAGGTVQSQIDALRKQYKEEMAKDGPDRNANPAFIRSQIVALEQQQQAATSAAQTTPDTTGGLDMSPTPDSTTTGAAEQLGFTPTDPTPVLPADTRGALDTAQAGLAQEENLLQDYTQQLAGMAADDPQRESLEEAIQQQQTAVTGAKANLSQAQTNLERVGMPSTTEMRADILEDPMSMVTTADVARVSDADRAGGKMAAGTGQAGAAATADTVAAAKAGDVVAPEVKEAATFTAEQTAQQVQDTLDRLTAVTGKPSAEALADAQTMDPEQLAQLGLTVDQINQAVTVQAPTPREVQEGELIEGSTVDMARVEEAVNFAAATGVPSTEATVQGQLTGLLEQFEGGETPPWAAGAMRAATATLAARGLGASSMAGQAVVQAAMESALPIAQQDAQTQAQFEAQNLSNRQQTAMFAAQERARFLGIEFDQNFQSRVANAAKISDIANINFSAEQQIALENARMAQTVDITNLQARNAKIMADAAAMSQLEITNLNNRQQAAVQNAQSFLQMDMTNLSNQQQVAMFKAQGNIQSIITDAAAANAAAQFNASSENQTNQFYDNLTTQVAQFNNEQSNAMERFNADQANAIAQFNASQRNARDQFNASQALVVEQANAQWEQAITTMENAAQNAANRDAAMQANSLTETTYNNMLQQERDALDYAWRSAESALQRESSLMIAEMQTQAEVDMARGEGTGKLLEKGVDFVLGLMD